MRKISIYALALALLSCWSSNIGYAEQAATTQRKFKTWTVASNTTAAKQEDANTSEWKKKLAARAAQKQAEDKSTQAKKASLKTAAKEKQKKARIKQKNKAAATTVRGKEQATYSDGWRMKNAQQKLRRLGYMSEAPTGKMTNATKLGLEKFQREQSFSVTGKLDERTYRKLEWLAFSKDGIKNLAGAAVVKEAAKYKGVRYVFGGTTPKGFDCSGYVQYVFKQLHAQVTRTADTQALEGVFVTQRQLKPGDLVFFSTYEPGASHCGIYAGNGKFWNATSSRGIALCGLQEDYWRKRYYGARRLLVSNGEPV